MAQSSGTGHAIALLAEHRSAFELGLQHRPRFLVVDQRKRQPDDARKVVFHSAELTRVGSKQCGEVRVPA